MSIAQQLADEYATLEQQINEMMVINDNKAEKIYELERSSTITSDIIANLNTKLRERDNLVKLQDDRIAELNDRDQKLRDQVKVQRFKIKGLEDDNNTFAKENVKLRKLNDEIAIIANLNAKIRELDNLTKLQQAENHELRSKLASIELVLNGNPSDIEMEDRCQLIRQEQMNILCAILSNPDITPEQDDKFAVEQAMTIWGMANQCFERLIG
jgi:hypothetical protein